ncbi:MAG: molybdopterin adenylyltransferase [Verrucomicrobiota bacterium]
MKVGRITLSDRASQGIYRDESGPEIERVLSESLGKSIEWTRVLIPDDQGLIEQKIMELVDVANCCLVITTGGTGPGPRDVTPEATRKVIEKELPGFGEIIRLKTYERVKTSILSRATAGIRGNGLILNLPGNPRAIEECLPLLIPAIQECLQHIGSEKR